MGDADGQQRLGCGPAPLADDRHELPLKESKVVPHQAAPAAATHQHTKEKNVGKAAGAVCTAIWPPWPGPAVKDRSSLKLENGHRTAVKETHTNKKRTLLVCLQQQNSRQSGNLLIMAWTTILKNHFILFFFFCPGRMADDWSADFGSFEAAAPASSAPAPAATVASPASSAVADEWDAFAAVRLLRGVLRLGLLPLEPRFGAGRSSIVGMWPGVHSRVLEPCV